MNGHLAAAIGMIPPIGRAALLLKALDARPRKGRMKRRMKRLLIFAPLLMLASCATPETRVRNALENAGLSPRMSECMAKKMVAKLSVGQLRRLGEVARAGKARNVQDFLDAIGAIDDPQTVSVTTRAALSCSLKL